MFKKTVSMAFTLALLGSSVAMAQAAPEQPTFEKGEAYAAELTRWNVDPGFFEQDAIGFANVRLDLKSNTLRLLVQRKQIQCHPGMACPHIVFAPMVFELPVVSQVKDGCGTVTVTAKEDHRVVDGDFQQLVLEDNTANHCPHFVALAPTKVVYTTEPSAMGGNQAKPTRSTFEGSRLEDVGPGSDDESSI